MITKLAKEVVEGYKPSFEDVAVPMLGAGAARQVAQTALAAGSLYGADRSKALQLSQDGLDKLRTSMRSTAWVNQNKHLPKFIRTLAASYDPNADVVRPGTSLATAAHEIGHSSGNRALMKLYAPSRLLGLPSTIMAARAGTIEGRAKNRKLTKDEQNEITAANALQYSSAPYLLEEGRATARGLRHLAKTHGGGTALRAAPYLAGAFGTYGLQAMAPYFARRVARSRAEKQEQQK